MSKGYIVAELGSEYNDEVTNFHDDGAVVPPSKVFTDKEKAKAELDRLNIKAFRQNDIDNYSYDGFEGFLKDGVTEEQLESVFADRAIDDLSDKEIKKLMKLVTLRFYELIEVEID